MPARSAILSRAGKEGLPRASSSPSSGRRLHPMNCSESIGESALAQSAPLCPGPSLARRAGALGRMRLGANHGQ
jgi:hypothetical protein